MRFVHRAGLQPPPGTVAAVIGRVRVYGARESCGVIDGMVAVKALPPRMYFYYLSSVALVTGLDSCTLLRTLYLYGVYFCMVSCLEFDAAVAVYEL